MGSILKPIGQALGMVGRDPQQFRPGESSFISPESKGIMDRAKAQTDLQTGRSAEQYGQSQEARNVQADLMKALQARSEGKTPSIAEQQLQQQSEQNIAAQNAAMAGARGINPALAARLVGNQAAQAQQQTNQQAAILRSQEQQAAEGALAGLATNTRGQDMSGTASSEATSLAQQSMLQQQAEADRRAQMAKEGINIQSHQTQQAAEQSQDKQMGDFVSNLGQAAVSFSDKELKKEVKTGSKDIKKFLDAISAKAYKYKESEHGEGKHVSPMAQDLERTDLGKSMVEDTPAGKVVNYGKGFGAILAAQAELNKRLKKIEGAK